VAPATLFHTYVGQDVAAGALRRKDRRKSMNCICTNVEVRQKKNSAQWQKREQSYNDGIEMYLIFEKVIVAGGRVFGHFNTEWKQNRRMKKEKVDMAVDRT
jgi:hypothetical protein